jgi:UDP-N-acetylmuramoyl-tripeptide--D-alanyl-D-alanine ligase
MALFTFEEIREVISAKLLSGEAPGWFRRKVKRVSTDSRDVRRGDLFVAFRGERFDGHQFVPAAIRRGAVGAIVEDDHRWPDQAISGNRSGADRSAAPVLLGVRDSLFAFQQLASHHRSRFTIPVVAVTGSNGKTTTKEFVASVLSERWRVLKTEGNLNNRIGVPQTLFRLTSRHQAAVIEMGVDQQGQTTRLCEIARPTIGIITNIGPDHLEFFGGMEGSAQAKAELLDQLPNDGVVVLNADDPYFDYLASRARCRVESFGFSERATVRAARVTSDGKRETSFDLFLAGKVRPITARIKVQGAHNVSNALAAAAVGQALSFPGAVIVHGLQRFRPVAMRSQVTTIRGVQVINDCYNANPASMAAALRLLAELGKGRRTVAVLGDMLELGPEAERLHRDVGATLVQEGIAKLVACGALGRHIAAGALAAGMPASDVIEVQDSVAAGPVVKSLLKQGDVLLAKASRGMRMEQVLEALTGARRLARTAS